jgi:ATP-dependent helicase HrpB
VDAEKGRFRLRTGNYATLAAADHLIQQPWIVAAHVDSGAVKAVGNQEGRIYLAAPLHENEVQRFSADRQRIFWDETQERVVAVKEKHLGPLILESKEIQQIPETERIALLLEIISEKGFQWSGFQEAFFNFCNRVESLRIWRPEEDWPEMHDASLKASLVSWLGPFLEGVKNRAQLQQVDAIAAVKTRLPWTLQTSRCSISPTAGHQ